MNKYSKYEYHMLVYFLTKGSDEIIARIGDAGEFIIEIFERKGQETIIFIIKGKIIDDSNP